MSRIGSLLLKELWQHGWVVALLAIFVGGVQGLLVLGTAVAPRTITMLEVHDSFMTVFLPLIALALARRLVVREYYAHTQRFLESLPLHRWEVFVTKLVVGATLVGGAAAMSFVVAALVAAFKEPVGGRWLLIVLWRTEGFAMAAWAFFFTMALLGRWRVPVYLALALVLLYVEQATEVALSRVPPLSLINETFVLERHTLPVADLALTALFVLGLVAFAALLALARDGQLAEGLAKTMSRRERVAVGVVLSLGMIVSSVVDPSRDAEPFAFEQDTVVRREGVAVLYLDASHRASAEALAERLTLDLGALEDVLGRAPGPLYIAQRPDLPVHRYEVVGLPDSDPGVLVRARFHDPAFDRARLAQVALAAMIERMTDRRAALEPRAWVRDGLAGTLARPDTEHLAAWYARQRRLRFAALDRGRVTEERFGLDVTLALAASAGHAVVDAGGEEAWHTLARDVLAEPSPVGLLAVIEARRRPISERLVNAGVTPEQLEAAWRARLAQASARDLPRAEATLEVDPEEGALRTVRWSVRFAGAAPDDAVPDDAVPDDAVPDDAVPDDAYCALVHAPLGPFDAPLDSSELVREERPCAEGGGAIVGRYSAGERVFVAVEIETASARLRLLAERRTLE